MRMNLASWDRLLRFFFGVFLTAWAVAGGPWWGYIGIYLILTGAWGLCPIYAMLKVQTTPPQKRSLVPPE
jgi:hypothetical protein